MASEPHQGSTPLVYTTTAEAGTGGGGGETTTLLFPKAAIEDFVASFIQKVGADSGDDE
jgi:hypothetical protein